MNWGAKNFHKMFAVVSLGFVLALATLVPCPARANTNTSSVKRDAASVRSLRAPKNCADC